MSMEAIIVILIAIAVGVSGQLAYLFIVDQEIVRASKGKIKELQKELKQVKPGDPRFKEIYSQMMSENGKVMKQSLKPTFVTFVPFIIVFLLMSSFFSYVPIAQGTSIQSIISGPVNGTLSFTNNCLAINDSSNLTLVSTNLPQTFPAIFKSGTCTAVLLQNGQAYNASLSSIIGSTAAETTYKVGNLSLSLAANPLVIVNLPFSVPLIGDQLNWFWTYLIITLISGITLNRIFIHYKLVA